MTWTRGCICITLGNSSGFRDFERFCCQKESHFVQGQGRAVTSIGGSLPSHPDRKSGPLREPIYEKTR